MAITSHDGAPLATLHNHQLQTRMAWGRRKPEMPATVCVQTCADLCRQECWRPGSCTPLRRESKLLPPGAPQADLEGERFSTPDGLTTAAFMAAVAAASPAPKMKEKYAEKVRSYHPPQPVPPRRASRVLARTPQNFAESVTLSKRWGKPLRSWSLRQLAAD